MRLFACATRLEVAADAGPWLRELAEWVLSEELRERRASEWKSSMTGWERWMTGLTYVLRESTWRTLAERVLVRPQRPHPPEARETIQFVGELLIADA